MPHDQEAPYPQTSFCPGCGKAVRSGIGFCTVCGQDLALDAPILEQPESVAPAIKPPQCPSCGKQLRKGAKFCNGCGTTISPATAIQEEVAPPIMPIAPLPDQPEEEAIAEPTPEEASPEPVEPVPEPPKCPACGKQLREGAKFCNGCGVNISFGEAMQEQAEPSILPIIPLVVKPEEEAVAAPAPEEAPPAPVTPVAEPPQCPACGKQLRKGAVFCTGCGQNLEQDVSTPAPAPVFVQPPPIAPALVEEPKVAPVPETAEPMPEETLLAAADAALQDNLCPACGAQARPGVRFCPRCGELLNESVTQQAYVPPPALAPVPAAPKAKPQRNKKKLAAILIPIGALLLGCIICAILLFAGKPIFGFRLNSPSDVPPGTEPITEVAVQFDIQPEGTTAYVEPTVTNRVEYKVATGGDPLNMREGPGGDHNVVLKIPNGETVVDLGEEQDGWLRVDYNGDIGWVSMGYLAPSSMAEPLTQATPAATNNATNITTTIDLTTTTTINPPSLVVASRTGNTSLNIANGGRIAGQGDWVYVYIWEDGIYKIKTDGTQKTKLVTSKAFCYSLNVVGDWLYYTSDSPTGIHKIRTDGTGGTTISQEKIYDGMIVEESAIYYPSYDFSNGNRVMRIAIDGSGSTVIVDSTANFTLDGNRIYYALPENTEGPIAGLYSCDLSGNNKTLLYQSNSLSQSGAWNKRKIVVASSYMYFTEIISGNGSLKRVPTNGGMAETLGEVQSIDFQDTNGLILPTSNGVLTVTSTVRHIANYSGGVRQYLGNGYSLIGQSNVFGAGIYKNKVYYYTGASSIIRTNIDGSGLEQF